MLDCWELERHQCHSLSVLYHVSRETLNLTFTLCSLPYLTTVGSPYGIRPRSLGEARHSPRALPRLAVCLRDGTERCSSSGPVLPILRGKGKRGIRKLESAELGDSSESLSSFRVRMPIQDSEVNNNIQGDTVKTYIGVPVRVETNSVGQDTRAMARGNMSHLPSGRKATPEAVTQINKRRYNRTRVWRAS